MRSKNKIPINQNKVKKAQIYNYQIVLRTHYSHQQLNNNKIRWNQNILMLQFLWIHFLQLESPSIFLLGSSLYQHHWLQEYKELHKLLLIIIILIMLKQIWNNKLNKEVKNKILLNNKVNINMINQRKDFLNISLNFF